MRSESDGLLQVSVVCAPCQVNSRGRSKKWEGRLTRDGFGAGRVVLVHKLWLENFNGSVLRRTQSQAAAHLVVQFGCPLVIPIGQDNREFIVVRVSLLLGVDDQGCSHAILIIDAGVRVVPVSSRASVPILQSISSARTWLERQNAPVCAVLEVDRNLVGQGFACKVDRGQFRTRSACPWAFLSFGAYRSGCHTA